MTALVLIASLFAAAPAGEIAYISVDAAGLSSLQLVNVRTHDTTLLAAAPALDTPVWSPDGKQIAWVSNAGNAVHLSSPDASVAPRQLDFNAPIVRHPRWSADGARIAATIQAAPEAPPGLAVYDTATGATEAWGGTMGRAIGGLVVQGLMHAEWLPSGRLVLALDPEQKLEIDGADMSLLRSEGGITEAALREDLPPRALLALALVVAGGRLSTEPVLVTRTQILPILLLPVFGDAGASLRFNEWNIVPNKDGDRVALESNQGGDREILVISRIGISNISNHHRADQNPVWGEDRRVLLFESFRHGRRGIYHAIADTARVTPIAAAKDYDAWSPHWAPGGEAIAYVSNATGTPELYCAQQDGRGALQLSLHPKGGMALAPAWRPEEE